MNADGGMGLSMGATKPGNPKLWVWNLRDITMVRCFSNLSEWVSRGVPSLLSADAHTYGDDRHLPGTSASTCGIWRDQARAKVWC